MMKYKAEMPPASCRRETGWSPEPTDSYL